MTYRFIARVGCPTLDALFEREEAIQDEVAILAREPEVDFVNQALRILEQRTRAITASRSLWVTVLRERVQCRDVD